MQRQGAFREAVLRYAKESFDSEPEYLWAQFPGYAVLRHAGRGRWYAVVMNVPRPRLGLPGEGTADILDVRCDPILIGSLRDGERYLPAYHMNKDRWITVVLDGSVPEGEVFSLLDMSFGLTK